MWYTFTYSWFAAVMFIKSLHHSMNKYRNTVPRGNTRLGSCEPLVITFLSTSWYVNLVYMCFCSPYLIHVVDLLTMSLWSITLWLRPTEASLTHVLIYFFPKHITALLCLETLNGTSVLRLAAILNSKITTENHKNVENVALNRLWKGHFFTVWELKQEGRVLLP